MCGLRSYRRKKAVITLARYAHLIEAYKWIKWDIHSAKVLTPGWGDKPQWTITGKYKGLTIMWTSPSPGGGISRMLVYDKKGKLRKQFSPAPLKQADYLKLRIQFVLI